MDKPLNAANQEPGSLHRHFGLVHATALNVNMIVGAGVFLTIPYMLGELPGPYALLGWLAAGALMILDGMIWSELGAAFPGSGGSYLYLLQAYGPKRWGRLMAFLFVWQFMISGPMEVATAFIAMANFSNALGLGYAAFNEEWTRELELGLGTDLKLTIGPARLAAFLIGVSILWLLYRR